MQQLEQLVPLVLLRGARRDRDNAVFLFNGGEGRSVQDPARFLSLGHGLDAHRDLKLEFMVVVEKFILNTYHY